MNINLSFFLRSDSLPYACPCIGFRLHQPLYSQAHSAGRREPESVRAGAGRAASARVHVKPNKWTQLASVSGVFALPLVAGHTLEVVKVLK